MAASWVLEAAEAEAEVDVDVEAEAVATLWRVLLTSESSELVMAPRPSRPLPEVAPVTEEASVSAVSVSMVVVVVRVLETAVVAVFRRPTVVGSGCRQGLSLRAGVLQMLD
jgi:hypothetical protein